MNRRDFTKLIAAAAGTAALIRPSQTARAASNNSPGSAQDAGGPWKLSLSEISTLNAPFAEDVRAYAAAGFDAIGLWEFKLPKDDDAAGEALRKAGLAVANCVPTVPSILPWDLPGMEGPRDPQERIDQLCASMGRLAKYKPASVLVISGPMGKFSPDKARALVIDGLRQIGVAARAAKVPLGLEPINLIQHDTTSFVNSIAGAMDLLKEADVEGLGIMADTYNFWNENPADLAAIASHVKGLHVADMPLAAQRTDRLLPLEGGNRTAALVSALIGGRLAWHHRHRDFLHARPLLGPARRRGGPPRPRRRRGAPTEIARVKDPRRKAYAWLSPLRRRRILTQGNCPGLFSGITAASALKYPL